MRLGCLSLVIAVLAARGEGLALHRDGRCVARRMQPDFHRGLLGAGLLHLREIEQIESGMVSIGGAGTFDGILLTGIRALYLAEPRHRTDQR